MLVPASCSGDGTGAEGQAGPWALGPRTDSCSWCDPCPILLMPYPSDTLFV